MITEESPGAKLHYWERKSPVPHHEERVRHEEDETEDQAPARRREEQPAPGRLLAVVDLHVGERGHDEAAEAAADGAEQRDDRAERRVEPATPPGGV